MTLEESLITHEGLRLKPYTDTVGKLSIGIGRNLTDNGITKEEAIAMMRADIATCIAELDRAFAGWRDHPQAIQDVLIEMQFNMGANRLAGFTQFWKAMKAKDYSTAAGEMLNSRWAKQVGKRAVTLADRLRHA